MKSKRNKWHRLSTKPGLLLAFIVNVIQSWVFFHYRGIEVSAMAYLLGAFTIFIFLVDNRDDRFLKGFFLIAYGVMIQFSYDLVFKKGLEGLHWEENVKMLLLMLTIASSGAGGSLIATHSDRSSTDVETVAISGGDEAIAVRFKMLEQQVDGFDRKLDRLLKVAGIGCVSLMIAGLTMMFLLIAH